MSWLKFKYVISDMFSFLLINLIEIDLDVPQLHISEILLSLWKLNLCSMRHKY